MRASAWKLIMAIHNQTVLVVENNTENRAESQAKKLENRR